MFGCKKLKLISFITAACLMTTFNTPGAAADEDEGWFGTTCTVFKYGTIAASAVGAVAVAPVLLAGAGFTSAGIAAGSMAAKMASVTAGIYRGAIPTGSAVAVLQSAGAAGIGIAGITVIGTAGAAAGYKFSKTFGCDDPNAEKNCNKQK